MVSFLRGKEEASAQRESGRERGREERRADLLCHVCEDVFDVSVSEGLALVEGDRGDVACRRARRQSVQQRRRR